jgi:nucleosome binding factor SPN SPT16 subunit
VDTIKVEDTKSTLLTTGVKSPKDTLFFLTQDSEEEVKPNKKVPAAPLKNGSPVKQKTAGTKVLRNHRRAVQDEVHQSAMAKMIEHQRELHENLQTRGLARYSENGGGLAGKEGKDWKKFQSYKGEGTLPPEVDKLRVCFPL